MAEYDFERSYEIARIGCPAGFCYPNAVRALRNRQRFVRHTVDLRGAKYVEGCVELSDIRPGIFMQHGWLELGDGTILDPTLAATDRVRVERTYYPAFRYSREELTGKRLNAFPIAERELTQFHAELEGVTRHGRTDRTEHDC